MGLSFRRTKRLGDDTRLNVSNRGASVSRRYGRRLTLNSRGGGVVPAVPRPVVAVWTPPLRRSTDHNGPVRKQSGPAVWRGGAVRHLWRLLAHGTVEPVNEHATDFGWAIDVIARRAAADAVAHLSARHQRRALPPAVNTAVYARFAELAEMMAPSHDEFEAAFDIAVHGTGEPV